MNEIKYIKGDATSPASEENKIIVHVCNDVGGWDRGFVLALSAKWEEPEANYRVWFKSKENFALGEVQFVKVEEDIWVGNMIGQRDTKTDKTGLPPIRNEAVGSALQKVALFAIDKNASVHMPRIGCGLAGGKWEFIEPIIMKHLIEKGIEVFVYDF
jgi:O-acetyl-ADP-ribose deacetylase (regulator of RNase III)